MSEKERLDQVPGEDLNAQPEAGEAQAAAEQDAPGSEGTCDAEETSGAAEDKTGGGVGKGTKKSKEEKAAEKKAKEKAKKKAKGNRLTRWLREMRSELKKVQWPSWKTVLKNTGIVILCVLVIGVFIWLFDALAHRIIQALMNLFS